MEFPVMWPLAQKLLMVSTRPALPVKVWYGVISAGELPNRSHGANWKFAPADAGISHDL